MISITIGNLRANLDIPLFCRKRIFDLLSPFAVTCEDGFGGARLYVNTIVTRCSLQDATPLGEIYYREHSSVAFELLCENYSFYVDLSEHRGTLSFFDAAINQVPVIYNAIKWFLVFESIWCGGVPLHSSLVADESCGLLFGGPSGTGKSTIAQLLSTPPFSFWMQGSDELNIIVPDEDGVTVAPTPFVSSGGCSRFTGAKVLENIFFLRHASRHSIKMLDFKRSFHHILKNSYTQPGSRLLTERLLSNVETVASKVPCGMLYFMNDQSVHPFINSYREMIREPALQP